MNGRQRTRNYDDRFGCRVLSGEHGGHRTVDARWHSFRLRSASQKCAQLRSNTRRMLVYSSSRSANVLLSEITR
jgi:hypothetical protein